MNLEDSRIYKSLTNEPFHKVAKWILRWTEEGRDVNFQDARQRTYLHIVAELAEKFRDPRAVPVVYQLCISGIDVDARNADGDTCLHMVVRREGTYRIIIALLRCGADPLIEDKQGRTAADILVKEKPPGWEENLHWLNKFSPGLKRILYSFKPDIFRIEQLLSYWCRILVYQDKTIVNLAKEAEKATSDKRLVALLRRHLPTNELAVAVLAGSPKRIKNVGSNGMADVNTTDKSYQYHYPHSPEVAQPLLAAAWEQNNYDVIDALMSLGPNSSVLYSNHTNKPKKPLFFHVISGTPKPDAVSILHRILRGSDLTRRNHKGQSVLFEAIKHRLHTSIARAIIQYGVNVASRDYKGRTARDYAEELGESDYVDLIDDYILNQIHEGNVDFIERIVMMSYDHVTDIIKADRPGNQKLCERLEENRLYKEMAKCLDGIPRLQRICKRIHQAVDEGDVEMIRKYSKGQATTCQNKCGQTLIHRAILTRDSNVIREVTKAFPHLINMIDNLDRSPLHYSNLLFGGLDEVSKILISAGAREDITDVVGRLPAQYRQSELTTHEYSTLYKEVVEFESTVVLREMSFESELNKAISHGDLQRVKHLVDEAGPHAKLVAFSYILFDCLDQRHPEIAAYLLESGCDPDIWKQYEVCDPTEDLCALGRCRHPVVSLYERCKELDYTALADQVEELKKEKRNHAADSFQLLANYGMSP